MLGSGWVMGAEKVSWKTWPCQKLSGARKSGLESLNRLDKARCTARKKGLENLISDQARNSQVLWPSCQVLSQKSKLKNLFRLDISSREVRLKGRVMASPPPFSTKVITSQNSPPFFLKNNGYLAEQLFIGESQQHSRSSNASHIGSIPFQSIYTPLQQISK